MNHPYPQPLTRGELETLERLQKQQADYDDWRKERLERALNPIRLSIATGAMSIEDWLIKYCKIVRDALEPFDDGLRGPTAASAPCAIPPANYVPPIEPPRPL